jgi:peptidoglycan/LPS O-acetylase OafA/YrhL
MPSTDRGYGFFGSLESLRGVAALVVVLVHASWLSPIHDARFVRNAYLLMDFFFVLSGFVICQAYGQRITNRGELRDFFLLRLGRMYPLHVTMLGVLVAMEVARFAAQARLGFEGRAPAFSHNTGAALVSNLLLTHSLGLHGRYTFNHPSWSISTEFYTYMLFALAVLAVGPRLKRWQLPVFVALSAASCGVLVVVGRPNLNVSYDYGLFRCAMGFFLGAASFLVFARSGISGSRVARAVAPYVAAAALTGGVLYLQFNTGGPSDYLVPPLWALLTVALAASPGSVIDRWLQIRPLAYLGRISYSVYMVQFVIVWMFDRILVVGLRFESTTTPAGAQLVLTDQITGTIMLLIYAGVVVLVSHVTYTWIEDRFRRKTRAYVAGLRARTARAEPAPRDEACTTAVPA